MFHMIHTEDKTIEELEEMVRNLQKKYFQAYNPQVRDQIVRSMEYINGVLNDRRMKEAEDQRRQTGDDFDKLINIS